MNKSQKIGLSLAGAAVLAVGTVGLFGPDTTTGGSPELSTSAKDTKVHMRTILDHDKAFPERIKAVRALPIEIENEDLKNLLAYLEAPLPEANRDAELVSLNEVMEQLRLKGRATEEYGKALARIILSPTSDEVVRDYAVQHAVGWLIDNEQRARKAGAVNTSPIDRDLLLSAVASLLNTESVAQGSAWGTTLNALRDLKAQSLQSEDIGRLFDENAELIRSVARGQHDAYVGNQVAAIQALPELGDRNASLALARDLVHSSDLAIGNKLPAIAVLGSLGSVEDLETLAKLEQSDRRLHYATIAASARIRASLSPIN